MRTAMRFFACFFSLSSTRFFQYYGSTSGRRWPVSLGSDQSFTCFRSRGYLQRYLLRSLNRNSPLCNVRGIHQRLSNFCFGASTLSSCSNKSRHCPSALILFSRIGSRKSVFGSKAERCGKVQHAH